MVTPSFNKVQNSCQFFKLNDFNGLYDEDQTIMRESVKYSDILSIRPSGRE